MKGKDTATFLVLAILLISILILELIWSKPDSMSLKDFFNVLLGNGSWANTIIVRDINSPRVITAIFVGAGLAVSGATMQAVFRNPMASPYILGLSSGASVGAAIGILFTIPFIPTLITTPLLAFVFCFATMFLVYSLSRVGGNVQTETLLLAGIAVGSMMSAVVSFLTFIAGDKIDGIVFWTMGNISNTSWEELCAMIPVISIGIAGTLYYSKQLNALMVGDSHALDLGIDVKRARFRILVITTALTAMSVAFVGSIGFVGLVIPHIFRILLGPDNRRLIPICIIGGATFMLICDYISRTVAPQYGVLPIGVVTALIGAPYFIYLVRHRKNHGGWS